MLTIITEVSCEYFCYSFSLFLHGRRGHGRTLSRSCAMRDVLTRRASHLEDIKPKVRPKSPLKCSELFFYIHVSEYVGKLLSVTCFTIVSNKQTQQIVGDGSLK